MKIKAKHFSSPGEIPHLFADAWNRYDAASIAALFKERAEFVNVVGLWWHSREGIYKAHDYGLREIFSGSKLSVGRTKVTPLGDGVTIIHARMTLTGQKSNGEIKEPGKRQNIFSFIAVQEDAGWICVSAHNTDVVPGKETNIVDNDGVLRPVDYRK